MIVGLVDANGFGGFEGCSSFESGSPVAVTLYRRLRIMYIMLNQVLCYKCS